MNRYPTGMIHTEKVKDVAIRVENGLPTKICSIVRRAQPNCVKVAILYPNVKVVVNGIVMSVYLAAKGVAILCVADVLQVAVDVKMDIAKNAQQNVLSVVTVLVRNALPFVRAMKKFVKNVIRNVATVETHIATIA